MTHTIVGVDIAKNVMTASLGTRAATRVSQRFDRRTSPADDQVRCRETPLVPQHCTDKF